MFVKLEGVSFTLNYADVFHHLMKPRNSDFISYIYILYYQTIIHYYLTSIWASFLSILI